MQVVKTKRYVVMSVNDIKIYVGWRSEAEQKIIYRSQQGLNN